MTESEELTYAYFFFTDIVGLSDPRIPTKRQIKKIEGLTNLITSCEAFKNTDPNLMLYLPTGDGMAVGFLSGPELPLMLAVELHKKLKEYNMGKFPEEVLRIRIGINDGPVYIVKGMSDSSNLWGPGILDARNVMDLGDDDHILLSSRTAEALWELSDEYRELIKPVHDYIMKDGKVILLYSAYGDGVGNPTMPKKNLYQKRMIKGNTNMIDGSCMFSKIEVTLRIADQKSMLTHYKKFHSMQNVSEKPMHEILHAITTHVRKKFDDMHIRVSDESGNKLKMTSINFDSPFHKEFTTRFNKPVLKGEKDRSYTLEYDTEEPKRYYESYVSCGTYGMSLIHEHNAHFKPVIYDLSPKGKKTRAKKQPVIRRSEDGLVKATWLKKNVLQGQAFRLEW
jgi:hypothetical protein